MTTIFCSPTFSEKAGEVERNAHLLPCTPAGGSMAQERRGRQLEGERRTLLEALPLTHAGIGEIIRMYERIESAYTFALAPPETHVTNSTNGE